MFLIHPSDLEQRRKSCRPAADKLLGLQRDVILSCNVCASKRHVLISKTDRYGLPLRTALCLECGLFYLVDRFSAASYSEFYASGAYRAVSSQFNRVTHDIAGVQEDQASYARILIQLLHGYVSRRDGAKLLDVGGSAGIVAHEFVREFGFRGTVLDPATDEVAAARALGLNSVVGSVEDWETQEKFDLILLCRSVEHLIDLRGALSRIRGLLTPEGLFYCDIVDFMEMCRLVGPPETVTKVDHCYWLTQSTALEIFRAVGFDVVSMNVVYGAGYAGFLLRACEPSAPTTGQGRVQQQIEEFQRIRREWTSFGGTSLGTMDWLRRKAYRLKRRIVRLIAPQNGRSITPRKAIPIVTIPNTTGERPIR